MTEMAGKDFDNPFLAFDGRRFTGTALQEASNLRGMTETARILNRSSLSEH